MDEVNKILSNPIVSGGLKIVAPQIALGIELIRSLFSSSSKPSLKQLLSAIDSQLASLLKELATTKSKFRRQELEIRIHTILSILNEWDKKS